MVEANPELPYSDAVVFFGATGDLAYKQIFPSLQKLAKRGKLTGPVIGVAKAGWNLDQLKQRAQDSVEKHGGLDPVGFPILLGKLRYVEGSVDLRGRPQGARLGEASAALSRHSSVLVRRGSHATEGLRLIAGRAGGD
jgi:glucose-6-phosphate 1-dehydrogenase